MITEQFSLFYMCSFQQFVSAVLFVNFSNEFSILHADAVQASVGMR